jgi:hypothetical protein
MCIALLGLPISTDFTTFAVYSTRPHQMHLAAAKHGRKGFTEVVPMTAEQMEITVVIVSARKDKDENRKPAAQSPLEEGVQAPQAPPPSYICSHDKTMLAPFYPPSLHPHPYA